MSLKKGGGVFNQLLALLSNVGRARFINLGKQ